MNKHGFTIIELLIATAISSMVSVVLFNAFFQINQTVKLADERMTLESRVARMQHYVDRDLSGATTVIQPEEKPAPKQQPPGQPQAALSQKPEEKEEQGIKAKPLEKIFVLTRQGNRLDSLTFITNNPLPKFWGAKDIKLTPNIARVTYHIKEDPAAPGSYLLMRQESSELDDKKGAETKARPYTMVDGLREITIKFLAKFEEEEQKKEEVQAASPSQPIRQPQETAPKKKKITYKEVDEWDSDKLEKEQKAAVKEKKKGAVQKLIPVLVTVQGSFWDSAKKRSFPFKFNAAIPTDTEFIAKPKTVPFSFTPPPQQPRPGLTSTMTPRAPAAHQIPLSDTISFLNKLLGPLQPVQPAPRMPMAGQGNIFAPPSFAMPGTTMPGSYTALQGRS